MYFPVPMPQAEDLEALKEIAVLGAINGFVEISSSELAEILGTSQQTASRRLLDLEKYGYIRREMGVRRQLIRLSEDGINVLAKEYAKYQHIFDQKDRLSIRGRVASGLGEGRYYLTQRGYVDQFQEKLGFIPYPGTLNLEVQGPETNKLRLLKSSPSIRIEAFQSQDRTFGAVDAWRARIGPLECALILPQRTHHSRTVELVSPDYLRDKLSVKDGDEIEVNVHL